MPYAKVMLRAARLYTSHKMQPSLTQADIDAIADRVVTSIEHGASMRCQRLLGVVMFWIFFFLLFRGMHRWCTHVGQIVEPMYAEYQIPKSLDDKSYSTSIPTRSADVSS